MHGWPALPIISTWYLPHRWANVLGVLSSTKTTSWSLLGIRQMRMRNISWRMTSCYYPSWKHSLSAHVTIGYLKRLMFSAYGVVERSVAPTNSCPIDPQQSAAPATRQTRPPAGIISCSVVCSCGDDIDDVINFSLPFHVVMTHYTT